MDILNIKRDDHINVTDSYVSFVMSCGCNPFVSEKKFANFVIN